MRIKVDTGESDLVKESVKIADLISNVADGYTVDGVINGMGIVLAHFLCDLTEEDRKTVLDAFIEITRRNIRQFAGEHTAQERTKHGPPH